ncbi:MAG: PglZ domain-containing protein [Polyangia bacterium]
MSDSFQDYLIGQITNHLSAKTTPPPFVVFCDPDREWLELLRMASEHAGFELWAPEPSGQSAHELLLRDRFHRAPRTPRVIWLGVARDEITWFKVFELQAAAVWEKSLLSALREYGVLIPVEHEAELGPLLPAHTRTWFGQPRSTWKELTPNNAKDTLIAPERMLEILAGETGQFQQLEKEGRFQLFATRAVEGFGLPSPSGAEEELWRTKALARLLCTEAAHCVPHDPPREPGHIIPEGLPRTNALKLLRQWQTNVEYIHRFEALVPKADAMLGLQFWARNLSSAPRSRGSRAVEAALFAQSIEQLDRIESPLALAHELDKSLARFQDRALGFWEKQASSTGGRIGWTHLIRLAEAASTLKECEQVDKGWKHALDAVEWYRHQGYLLDTCGEMLFQENADAPQSLVRIRARLRRGYLQALNRIGRAFSDLLASGSEKVLALPTAGELAAEELGKNKQPTALLFLDAFRLELGYRLARTLNAGEPADRAVARTAVAPIPSITALGMAFALPIARNQLRVSLDAERRGFQVSADGWKGDLTSAEQRRKWLTKHWGVTDFLSIKDVLDGETLKPGVRPKRLLVVHGKEVDSDGHEGQLELSGADEHLDRYAQAIRRLRDVGYMRVVVVTDHGFFHYAPEEDEREVEKPTGEILWQSRRAIVGRQLTQKTALRLSVMGSDLQAVIPRSVAAFRTYGGLGFFHGGATLQELIIPVVVVTWPSKAAKVDVVLKPLGHITSKLPRVQVAPAHSGQQAFFSSATQLARRVTITVRNPATGKPVFRHDQPVTVQPGEVGQAEPTVVQLRLVEDPPPLPFGSKLLVSVVDAENEEDLANEEIVLRVDLDDEF